MKLDYFMHEMGSMSIISHLQLIINYLIYHLNIKFIKLFIHIEIVNKIKC